MHSPLALGCAPALLSGEIRWTLPFAAEINRYKGRESIQLVIKDARWSRGESRVDDADFETYRLFCQQQAITPTSNRLLHIANV